MHGQGREGRGDVVVSSSDYLIPTSVYALEVGREGKSRQPLLLPYNLAILSLCMNRDLIPSWGGFGK